MFGFSCSGRLGGDGGCRTRDEGSEVNWWGGSAKTVSGGSDSWTVQCMLGVFGSAPPILTWSGAAAAMPKGPIQP